MTYREIIYLILDEVKLNSDDNYITEDHVKFLVDKYRAFVLKKQYADIKKQIPESNYQTICLNLTEDCDIACVGSYLKSIEEVPFLMTIGNPRVYATDYYQGEITYVTRDRMRYVGNNKYLKNIIYSSLGPDNHLYFKSSNPQHKYLQKVKMTAIFQDSIKAAELACCKCEDGCDILDLEFPLEGALVSTVVELALKEILGAAYRPKDDTNNAKDDISDIATFIRQNIKSNLAKQIDGTV